MSKTELVAPPQAAPAPSDELQIERQLNEFLALRDGWLWGEGRAPTASGLDRLAAAFAEHYPAALPRPRLYPTAEGGVQAEWVLGRQDISLTIDLPDMKAYWHALDLDSGEDADRHLDLSLATGWDWATAQLRALSGSGG